MRYTLRSHVLSFAVLVFIGLSTEADVAAQAPGEGPLDGLKWRSIGPANMGGRIADVAVAQVPGAPDAIYVGTATGGLWKSVDDGANWNPVFDSVDGLIGIGAVAVAPSNPNVVWVGTGEANNRQSSSWGEGVYKSMDAGANWAHMGIRQNRHVSRIVIHPRDPDIVYVAAMGHLWGPSSERGVYKTTDGGETWELVLHIDEHTGAIDLRMDPQDPQTLFAAMYQRQRRAWGFAGGGPGSGIYRTYDGGRNWTELTEGLPEGDKGRIGLDIYQRDGRTIYAIVEADRQRGFNMSGMPSADEENGGVFRSTDRGETWEQVNTINPRPMYFSQIRIDPKDPQRIYLLGMSIMSSSDGARTFDDPGYGGEGVHPDHHAMWIDPEDSNHLILGNDGGVYFSRSRGETWRFVDNLPIAQFYEIGVDMRDPYYVCGGLQDNGSWCIPSATRDRAGISNDDAYLVGSSDGYYVLIDPNDHNVVYVEGPGGRLGRFNASTGETQAIRPVPSEKPNEGEEGFRFDWNTPVVMSRYDPSTLYLGANVVFKSGDRGVTWSAISPDLTTATDRDTLEMMGHRVTDQTLSRHDGTSSFPNLTTLSESPLDQNVLYAGSDDGKVHVTLDGGSTWNDLTSNIPGLPQLTYVSRVVASHHAGGRVYATFDGHYNDDYHPYAYVSNDFGQTWQLMVRGLPETSVNIVREHPRTPNLLFLGHEKGVHVSVDGGANWASLNGNMPSVPVDDLIIHPRDNDLIAGTHGRSIWILDDIAPLEALTEEVLASQGTLIPTRPARMYNTHHYTGWFWAGHHYAANPDYGAGVAYWLSEGSDEDVEITIRDTGGEVLRTLAGPAEPGLNRVFWDLRPEPPREPPPGPPGFFNQPPRGPTVLPGIYQVTVHGADGTELEGQLQVDPDPRSPITEGDRRDRHAALLELYELQKILVQAGNTAKSLSEQIDVLQRHLAIADLGEAAEPSRLVEEMTDRLSEVESDIGSQTGAIDQLLNSIDGYTSAPRPDDLRQIGWAFEDITGLVEALNRLAGTDLPALYTEFTAEALWPRAQPPIPLPRRPDNK